MLLAAPLSAVWLRAHAAQPYATPPWLIWGTHVEPARREDHALPVIVADIGQPMFAADVCSPAQTAIEALRQACARVAHRWTAAADTLAQRPLFAELARGLDPAAGAEPYATLQRQYDRIQSLLWNGRLPARSHAELVAIFEREGELGFARRLLQDNGIAAAPPDCTLPR